MFEDFLDGDIWTGIGFAGRGRIIFEVHVAILIIWAGNAQMSLRGGGARKREKSGGLS